MLLYSMSLDSHIGTLSILHQLHALLFCANSRIQLALVFMQNAVLSLIEIRGYHDAVWVDHYFLPRDAMQARPMSSRTVCPSVCLSVRPSRSWILSKRINVSSIFFHHRVATPFWFFNTKRHGNIPTDPPTPLTGALNAGDVGKNRDLRPVSGFIACCRHCDRLDVINRVPPDRGKL